MTLPNHKTTELGHPEHLVRIFEMLQQISDNSANGCIGFSQLVFTKLLVGCPLGSKIIALKIKIPLDIIQ